MSILKVALLSAVSCFLSSICAYEIAPITEDMTQVSNAVIADLLPSTGVTQSSSVGWQRLAYICGKNYFSSVRC
jgi:hypothetical protein